MLYKWANVLQIYFGQRMVTPREQVFCFLICLLEIYTVLSPLWRFNKFQFLEEKNVRMKTVPKCQLTGSWQQTGSKINYSNRDTKTPHQMLRQRPHTANSWFLHFLHINFLCLLSPDSNWPPKICNQSMSCSLDVDLFVYITLNNTGSQVGIWGWLVWCWSLGT